MSFEWTDEVVKDLVQQFNYGTTNKIKGVGKRGGFSKLAEVTKKANKTLKKAAEKNSKNDKQLKTAKKAKISADDESELIDKETKEKKMSRGKNGKCKGLKRKRADVLSDDSFESDNNEKDKRWSITKSSRKLNDNSDTSTNTSSSDSDFDNTLS